MTDKHPALNICRFKVKPGKQAEMEALLARHWPALHKAGLVTDRKPQIYRGLPSAKPGGQHGAEGVYIEMFEWRDPSAIDTAHQLPAVMAVWDGAIDTAHQLPAVMAVWEPMGAICEEMDFPEFECIELAPPKV